MMTGLVAAFMVQTALVYTDQTPLKRDPLSPLALRGRALWHANNCQTCHQFYGFGGFLGPDLTNAAPRLSRDRLDTILTEGYGQMPPFGMSSEQIDAIQAYLTEVDRTGVGQARRFPPVDPKAALAAVDAHAKEHPFPGNGKIGRALFAMRCTTCHCLFQSTPLGPFVAADLTSACNRLNARELHETLIHGRPDKGMPPTALPDDQCAAVYDFLSWLAEHREALCRRLGISDDQQSMPWFEFK